MTVPTRVLKISEVAADQQYAVVGGPFGSKLGRKDYIARGVPVLRGSNLPFDKRIDLTDLVFVSAEKIEQDLFGNLAHPGDIIVTQRGTLGQVGLIPTDCVFERFIVSQSQMKLTVDSAKADARFLYYYLKSPGTTRRLIDRASSSGVPHINLDVFRNFDVELPDLGVQRSVADALTCFDDLIDNNRRRIEILEGMARLLYREWFVHFRYPGHEDVEVVDSDLGPIPEEWTWRNLFDLAEVRFGFSFKSNRFAESGSTRVVRIRDVPRNTTSTYTDEDPGERYEIRDGDTLIGMDGDFHMCRWADGLAHLNQRVARLRSKGQLSQLHLHLALEQPIQRFNQTILGTTVAHLGKRHLEEIFIAAPPQPVLAAGNEPFLPIFELELNLRKQNRLLQGARDLLLPRLVSGELDVSELGPEMEGLGA